ncbi:MAG: M42 family metallopeptidase [Bacillota bacterium]|nr:M42 family metallopeptidase [Bacillota bacterium]
MIQTEFLKEALSTILNIESPSGYTHHVMERIAQYAKEFGYEFKRNRKGGGLILLEGQDNSRTVSLSGHVDTLGAMVRSIDGSGNLIFTKVGGPILATLDGEYGTVITRDGKRFRGTFLSKSPAAHVFSDSNDRKRDEDNMYFRLDANVRSKEDTLHLGIGVGDYICIDPKLEFVGDFVKSRFLDDKASVACILTALKHLADNGLKPKYRTVVLISNYEEVGHGASHIPHEIDEMLAVDMGCIGKDLTCTEFDVSICAKDSSGPYDYHMVSGLIESAKKNEVPYAVDIYPYYGSDASAALRAGNDIRAALIGPGVHASHGMERTTIPALEGTTKLILAYLLD